MILFGTIVYFVFTFWVLSNVDDWGFGAFVAWLLMNAVVMLGTTVLGFA